MNAHVDKKLKMRFLRYAGTGVAAMVAMSCYILADTFFISLKLGAEGLAALNFALPVYYFIYGIGLMTGIGGATVYSSAVAEDNKSTARAAFTHAVIIGALFSVALVVAGLFLSEYIAGLMGAEGAVVDMSRTYLRVLLLFSPAFILCNIVVCFVRNDGAPALAMAALISGSLSNILLDYIFIFVCGMGMFGAVLATCLAPVISLAVSCVHFLMRRNNFSLCAAKLSARIFGRIFAFGASSLVEQFSSALVILVFNYIILGIAGQGGVAAYGVVANISLVVLSVFSGLVQGVQPLISGCGEEDFHTRRALLIYAVVAALTAAVVIYIIILLAAPQIAEVFNGGGDEQFGATAAEGLRLYFIGVPFFAFNVSVCGYLSASSKPLPAQIISLLRGLILIIPAAFLLSFAAGLTGAWLSWPLSEAIVAVVCICVLTITEKSRIKLH